MMNTLRSPKRESGFSLIEVLVSAVILSVGLIGVAGLQALSLNSNQSAFMRSQASTLAYNLADRMRSNVASATASLYAPGAAAVAAGCSTTSGCNPQQMARNDLAEWNAAISTYLPMGQGFVCIDSTPQDGTSFANPQCDGNGTQFAVKIWWDDNRDGAITVTPVTATTSVVERLVINFQL